MKWWLLNKVADEINKNNYIFSLCRAGDNLFWLGLDVSGGFLFDLENKNVLISEKRPTTKSYSATIDVWLAKNCNKAKILNANVKERDKILEINIEAHSGYKIERFTLRFEFIPPKGAFIILQNDLVSCAEPLFAKELSLAALLSAVNDKSEISRLASIKKRKIDFLEQKISKLAAQITALELHDDLNKKSKEAFISAEFIESNMHLALNGAQTLESNGVKITLGYEKSVPEWKDFYYSKSKKLKQKALGVAQRYENLNQKIVFWQKLCELINLSSNESDIISLDPPRKFIGSKKDEDWHDVFYKDVKIMIGKSAIGNEKLLKLAKAGDLWFHLQGVSGAHVLTRGKGVKPDVIQKSAELCAAFSGAQQGTYLVDYTIRQNVSPVSGANVKYVNYKTIQITL